MALSNFGEQFAAKTLRRVYAQSIFPVITNSAYEGEIKKAGDRVNILSLPGDFSLEDYVAGTDMTTFPIFDLEEQLVVEKRKAHSFAIDRLEDLFTYVDDLQDNLAENQAKAVEKAIDTYVLEQVQYAKAGNWVGIDIRVTGSSRDTEASIATTATGGTLSVQAAPTQAGASVEHGDGTLDYAGFTSADLGKPVRLTSGTTWATPFYRISAVTDSQTVSIVNWDEATSAHDIPNGDILRGLYGDQQFTGGLTNGDGKPTTQGGWGWELQAGRGTTIAAANIFETIVFLKEKLDREEIQEGDRHVTFPVEANSILLQASELQPSGVESIYRDTVVNGRVMRVAGIDVHVVTGSRVTTRLAHSSVSSGTGADIVLTDGVRNHQVLANHISYCTFAYKWAESRVVDAENQFAKKYQALHLWGARVPLLRRRAGACLFGSI